MSETTLRENNARREHKRHVRDLLAQAIVHRTLDAERGRQVHVRRRLEEIAKIELVKRVQVGRFRSIDQNFIRSTARLCAANNRSSQKKKLKTKNSFKKIEKKPIDASLVIWHTIIRLELARLVISCIFLYYYYYHSFKLNTIDLSLIFEILLLSCGILICMRK